ncbi:MAG: type IV pilus modification protein PilV [Pseudomonadota bacterium]
MSKLGACPAGMRRTQRGVTLLEVLISIVVLSIGLLGYAGLQTASLKNNTSAFQRSQATMLTYDIIDRMRANRPSLASYQVDFGTLGSLPDLVDWKGEVEAALPDGDARIEIDPAGNATITIQWDDNRDGSDPVSFVTKTYLEP